MTSKFLLILACAFAVGVGTTPLVRRLALRFEMLDYPDSRRIHSAPVPLLGGVAIYLAVIVPLFLYTERYEIVQFAGIVTGATLVAISGLWDDRKGLAIPTKLSVQTAAAVVLYLSGVRVQLPVPEAVNVTLSLAWVLTVTNAFNLIDNLDGLCAGVGAVASGLFLVMAALNGQYLVGAFAAALSGACAAFLIYNISPARIFMGDAGSLFIGFLSAVAGIKLRFPDNISTVTWLVPVLVLGVPLFDMLLVTVSRLRRGLNPATTPGTDHVAHRLMRVGLSRRGASAVHYAATAVLGGIAIVVSLSGPWIVLPVGLAVTSSAVTLFFVLERPGLSG